MIKKIFSILIIFILFITPLVEVSAAVAKTTKTPAKTVSKTAVKKTTAKKVVKKTTKKKTVAKKKYIIANPPLITLETAPHSPKR